MSLYQKLSKNPRKFYRFTSLSLTLFQSLVQKLKPLWEEAEFQRLSRPERQREMGAGRKYKLNSLEDKLLVVLFYLRLYVTYELLEHLFALHSSNLNRLVNRLEPLLADIVKPRLPKGRKKKVGSWEEFCNAYPDLVDVVLDATEQKIQRPKGKKQKKYYSGKKKNHALKTQIAISQISEKILTVSSSIPAATHDFELLKQSRIIPKFPLPSNIHVDLGYQGIVKEYPNHCFSIPDKKPKGKELTETQKNQNKKKSKIRITVEHVFAHLKTFQILAQTYRNKRSTYSQKFQIIAGLYNLKLQSAC